MARPIGRPGKYKEIVRALKELTAYTPGTIAYFARDNGFLKPYLAKGISEELIMQRIRITMGRLSNNHAFPDQGDCLVIVKGRPPYPGWFSWRWQSAYI